MAPHAIERALAHGDADKVCAAYHRGAHWDERVEMMHWSSEYGTHSLRRTKASIIDRATGNLRAVQILLGHSKIENTIRDFGIDMEDALALAENTEI